jgi:antitoxin CptB
MDEPARLKWQCRRGTKELDLMLKQYLETGYLVADQGERDLFVELLGLEDDMLMRVLMGDLRPETEKFAVFTHTDGNAIGVEKWIQGRE